MELYRWNINDNMDASWPDVLYQKENAVYAIPNGRVCRDWTHARRRHRSEHVHRPCGFTSDPLVTSDTEKCDKMKVSTGVCDRYTHLL